MDLNSAPVQGRLPTGDGGYTSFREAEECRSRCVVSALVSLALGAFAIGCTEFAAVALIPQLAADLRVSEAAAGQLVTLNAFAVVVGAPLLGSMSARASARNVAVGALMAFAAAHIAAALAESYPLVLVTRIVSGAMFGLYLAVAFAAATRLARASGRASAMAVVQSGITASTALGLPAGLALGRAGGGADGWRLPFVVIAGLAMVAAAAIVVSLPHFNPGSRQGGEILARIGVLRRGRVMLGLVTTAVFWGGSFGGLTFLVLVLEDRVGISVGAIIAALLFTGALSVVGNFAGGRAADRRPALSLVVTSAAAVVGLVLLFGFSGHLWLALVGLGVWQLATWSFVPVIQARVYDLGGDQAEAAVSYAVAAFNLGIVAGAAIGGLALDLGGLPAVGAVSIAFAVVAVGLAVAVNAVVRRLRGARSPVSEMTRDNGEAIASPS
jgi:DHA1 family inner membrane transport protein